MVLLEVTALFKVNDMFQNIFEYYMDDTLMHKENLDMHSNMC